MTTFDNREKAFEDMFVHDEDVAFKVRARRTKLLASWAAEQLGLTSDAAAAYVQGLTKANLSPASYERVLRILGADFNAKGFHISDQDLRAKGEQVLAEAVQQVQSGL